MLIDVNGTRLNVIEEGGGQAVLLLHGLGGSWREWAPQVDGLSDRFRCVAIEHRGHGRSERTNGRYSIELFADDTAAACEALGITHTHVAGLAMGGMVAQSLALRYPELVDTLVLVNTAAQAKDGYREGLQAMAQYAREHGFDDTVQPGGTVAGWAWSPRTVAERPDVVRDSLRETLSTDPDVYARAATAAAEFDVTDQLDDIHQPTLMLWGEHDVLVPLSYGRTLLSGIPGSDLVVVTDAGALPTVEQPAMVNQAMTKLFDDNPCSWSDPLDWPAAS